MREGKPLYGNERSSEMLIFDWRTSPDDIMKAINERLKAFGLEIVNHETNSDFYAFSIVKLDDS